MVSKDDAISRSALVNDMKGVVFREKPFSNADVNSLYQSIKDMYSGIIYLVETAPALDAVPVVHARWILKHVGVGHYWECSACHTNPCIYVTENTKFCPNCGARMDGDSDG